MIADILYIQTVKGGIKMTLSGFSTEELIEVLSNCGRNGQCSRCRLIGSAHCRTILNQEVIKRLRASQNRVTGSVKDIPDKDLVDSLNQCYHTADSRKRENCALNFLQGAADCYATGLDELIDRFQNRTGGTNETS